MISETQTAVDRVFLSVGRVEVPNKFNRKSLCLKPNHAKSEENSQHFQIFQVPNKFGFSGFQDKNTLGDIGCMGFAFESIPSETSAVFMSTQCSCDVTGTLCLRF